MTTRYLIVADAVDRLNPVFDLGVCVSVELIKRGIQADYLDLYAADADRSSGDFLSSLPVRTIRSADPDREAFWELGPERKVDIADYRVVLHRTDPPVDERFIRYAKHFETAPHHRHRNPIDRTLRCSLPRIRCPIDHRACPQN